MTGRSGRWLQLAKVWPSNGTAWKRGRRQGVKQAAPNLPVNHRFLPTTFQAAKRVSPKRGHPTAGCPEHTSSTGRPCAQKYSPFSHSLLPSSTSASLSGNRSLLAQRHL